MILLSVAYVCLSHASIVLDYTGYEAAHFFHQITTKNCHFFTPNIECISLGNASWLWLWLEGVWEVAILHVDVAFMRL